MWPFGDSHVTTVGEWGTRWLGCAARPTSGSISLCGESDAGPTDQSAAVLLPLLSLKDHQLLSEGHVLKGQIPATPQRRYKAPYRNPDPFPHRCPLSTSAQEPGNLGPDEVFATHPRPPPLYRFALTSQAQRS